MEYCGNCGEAAEGRFCRMCGAPVGFAAAEAPLAAQQGYGPGYGGFQAAPVAEATQMLTAPPGAGYGGYAFEAPAATPAEFDGLFRNEDGSPGAHGQTQLLPPVVEADYRMRAPDGAQSPPAAPTGSHRQRHDEDAESNRPMILVIVAVVVAAVVILVLLYLGSQSTAAPPASTTTPSATGSASGAAAGGGAISVPTDGATLPPSAPPSTSADVGTFHGDTLPLGPGSSGTWVKWVQEKLKSLGYYHGSATGDFTQATAVAVQQFQAAAGVTGDAASTVGMHTIVALDAAGTTPDLKPGSRSSAVTRLNSALTYATGRHVSGSRYSAATEAAVLDYQRAVGLQPTGQVDAATWAKLQDGTLATG